jgi:hypothetical protein
MDYVAGVSWPRSGHHMLVRLLKLYFGSEFNYYNSYADDVPFDGVVPPPNKNNIHFSKSHDFNLDMPQLAGQKYLVQYRDFINSTVSNYELFVLHGGEDSPASFQTHASNEFSRYKRFMSKWVTTNFKGTGLLIEYNNFLENPQKILKQSVLFFKPDSAVNLKKIEQAIARVDGERVENAKLQTLKHTGVHEGRDVKSFRYYTPELFNILSRLSLSSETVNNSFQKLLSRNANQGNMLPFQTYETIEKLETFIRGSTEFKNLNSKGRS